MKKITLLVFAALIIVGCEYQNSDGSYSTSKSLTMKTIVIDSCEYINWSYKLAHKGNCRFCKERREKEFKKLVKQLKKK